MLANGSWIGVERLLGSDPEFGDGSAIEQRSLARLRVGMAALAAAAPDEADALSRAAAAPDADLLAMMRDPVLRNAFETDLRPVAGPEPGGALLQRLLPLVQNGSGYALSRPTGKSATPAWPALGRTWVLTGMPPRHGDPVAERLADLLSRAFPDPTSEAPIPPSAEQLQVIERAAELLTILLPTVGPAVLRHVGIVGLARDESPDGPLHSVSGGDPFPAAVFVSPEKLHNVWDAAGALLHEGLHLTLFEIIRCGAVVSDHVDPEADIVSIPWRVEAWSLMRVLFALHVYVHLAAFHGAARSAGPGIADRFGTPPLDAAMSQVTLTGGDFRTPTGRAIYLAGELRRRSQLLTEYGVRLVGWLTDVLDQLSSSPGRQQPGTRYRAVDPASIQYLPDQQRVVLAILDPLRLRWLNVSSWLVFSLCDGRDIDAILEDYVAAVASLVPRAEAERHVAAALPELMDHGMVVAIPTVADPVGVSREVAAT
jgi:hypothetical protein